ncbi:hypothetical protein H3H36_01270 [Duganella sp. FT3S]|uniref:Uncharacterized protein n=1 Tax=Rugamonas fusca TaxID=2758568 RepID=A0A7W2I561_9BURK|nr:hypothetical protein [Rugamonas fusca]MBA5603993.1 hypothetical protein [Rugamonas fusca]
MRHLITAGFVAAALVAYYQGFEYGSGIVFLAGVAFELVLFKRIRDSSVN